MASLATRVPFPSSRLDPTSSLRTCSFHSPPVLLFALLDSPQLYIIPRSMLPLRYYTPRNKKYKKAVCRTMQRVCPATCVSCSSSQTSERYNVSKEYATQWLGWHTFGERGEFEPSPSLDITLSARTLGELGIVGVCGAGDDGAEDIDGPADDGVGLERPEAGGRGVPGTNFLLLCQIGRAHV